MCMASSQLSSASGVLVAAANTGSADVGAYSSVSTDVYSRHAGIVGASDMWAVAPPS